MTVQTTNTFNITIADGIETSFNFTFQSLDATWVKAQTTDPGGDPIQRADITVNLNADQENNPGGTVVFDTAPVVGAETRIYRDTPQTQNTDYTDYDAFPAESHEDALDKLTMISQEIESPGSEGGECADFLPLAGGVMTNSANIDWVQGGVAGRFSYGVLLSQPSFLWAPVDTVSDEIGYSWGAANGKILGYNTDGRFSLALVGRTLSLAQLVDDDVITLRDLNEAGVGADPVYNSVTWDHQTNEPAFGNVGSGFKATTLATVGAQALVFETSIQNYYQGYKFIMGDATPTVHEIDFAAGNIWLGTAQTEGGANDPLANTLVTRSWVEDNIAGGATWGSIIGTLSDQTDLQGELDAKAGLTSANNFTNSGCQFSGGLSIGGLGLQVTGNTAGVGVNVSANLVVGGISTFSGTINMQNNKVLNVGTPTAGTDGTNKTYVDGRTPQWAISKAVGGWLSTGAAQGTQRGCTVAKGGGTGQYRVTLSSPLTSIANCTFTATAFGALVGIDIVFAITSTSIIDITCVRSDTGAAIDVGCTFDVKDRGLT